jgi:hypothetical protein
MTSLPGADAISERRARNPHRLQCTYMHQTGAAAVAVSARIKCTLGCTDEFAYKYWGREAGPAACTHCIFWQRLPSCQTRFLCVHAGCIVEKKTCREAMNFQIGRSLCVVEADGRVSEDLIRVQLVYCARSPRRPD